MQKIVGEIPVCLITADYCRPPQTTTDYRRPIFPHRRPIFIYRRPILTCGKATWKMANYGRPHSTYRRPILCNGKAT